MGHKRRTMRKHLPAPMLLLLLLLLLGKANRLN
jgi:hypothetical protein